MTYFLGNTGTVKLGRANQRLIETEISPDDVNTVLNRVGFRESLDNLITGDKIIISTSDNRGIQFVQPSAWSSAQIENSITAHVNVNAAGGLRFFRNFNEAINNDRSGELPFQPFVGTPLPVLIEIKDITETVLGDVTGYTFNTEREGLDTTTLSDKFKRMYSAGLISGNGSIDCLFSETTTGFTETPLLALQLIHRIDIGSEFNAILNITNSDVDSEASDIFYEFSAMVTRAGVTVSATEAITCTIDFVTTGEIRLLIGKPSGYVLKEDDEDRINLELDIGYLLTEIED